MDRIDQGFEFLNYENVCPAEKVILHHIIQGAESQEYSKGLFAFDTPFNDKPGECLVEFGQGECEGDTNSVDDSAENVPATLESSNVVEEVSAQYNGAVLTMPTVSPHATTIVSQTGPLHGVTSYYPGQAHLPIAVSAASAPISSVGPAPITNNPPPGNPMMMFSPGMSPMIPHQSYYPAYYGPGPGGNSQHMTYVDNSGNESYLAHPQGQSQNHHKLHHDAHHSGPHANSASQQGTTYNKGRRKQPQPPPSNYYYNPYFQQVPSFYNQQQLQNVTGHPIIMGPGMYLPHHPGMYAPQGNEIDHHGNLTTQSMVPIPNDMSFAQHHHQSVQMYSHSPSHTPRNLNPHSTARTSGPPLQTSDSIAPVDQPVTDDTRVGEKSSPSSNNEVPTSSSDTPKSMPDLSNSNGTIVSTPEKETSTDPDANNAISPAPVLSSMNESQVVNGADAECSDSDYASIPEQSSKTAENVNKDLLDDPIPSYIAKPNPPEKLEAVPTKQVNGVLDADCPNKSSSKFRDNLSADHNSSSDVRIEQDAAKKSSEIKSYSSSLSKNSTSQNIPTVATNRDGLKTNEISTIEVSKSSSNVQCENKSNRSWASIASVKTHNILNDGAAARYVGGNHAQVNHGYENTVGSCVDVKLTGSNNVPTNFASHSEFVFEHDENDPIAFRLGEHLCKYVLDHQSIPLAPRGLYNQSNSCFLNAILQALLACPPFVNIFRSLASVLDKTPCKSAPVTQNVFEFVREFTPLIRSTATKKDKSRDSFIPGPNLEPSGIRKSLALLSKDTFKIEGRQEDAEEFLSFLLNSLHEEMIKVAKLLQPKIERIPEPNDKVSAVVINGVDTEELKDDDDDQWQVMGAKNKSCLTRRTAVTKSPISEAFLGQMCLSLSQVNAVKKAHLEPFFTLQLAIQNENIKSVKDALEAISIKEEVSGMTSATGNEVEAWRQVSLEELPPILILHLKRFVYEKNGIHKINKKLDYSVDLEIGKELLSTSSKSKFNLKQRQYKLFAVVYHDGEDAHKGHYVADCFHPSGGSLWGQWGWLRYDDTSVKPVSEANMLNPQPPRVPYLLLYRRQDTILQQQSKKGS